MSPNTLRIVLRWLLSAVYVTFGFLHLKIAPDLAPLVPNWVHDPLAMIKFTGLCEIVGGLGLLVSPVRPLAGIMLAIYALQFFAIPRVMLDGVEPFAAMKESFSACLANIGAFLVFGVVFSVLCCVAAMVLIWIPIIGWIVMAGVGTVILGAALFVAWRQVYAGAAAATSAMPPPPAPQAPPPQP